MEAVESAAVIAAAYLLGAFPSAYFYARALRGIDLRRYGSGNVGISNFSIHAGRKAAVPLILFDIFVKGMLPVVIASPKVLDLGVGIEAAAGFAAIAGHNWSVFLRFAGGRGMATVLGVTAALNWPLVVLYGSVAGLGWLATRSSALWWGIAALILPVWSEILRNYFGGVTRVELAVTLFSVSFLVVTAIKRLASNRGSIGAATRAIPWPALLWNRLLFDRDISSREKWVNRRPGAQAGTEPTEAPEGGTREIYDHLDA